jgi:hypothetical protein
MHAQGLITMDNGEGPLSTTPDEIVSRWEQTLGSLDAVLHQVRNGSGRVGVTVFVGL